MSAINVPGRARLHRVRSITSPRTGRKTTSIITSDRASGILQADGYKGYGKL